MPYSNLFLNNSHDQNIPLYSFMLIQKSCLLLPWDPLKNYSSIVGQTCSDISQSNDPSTLIEFYLPIQEYLPEQHVPDMSAHACKDIVEVVKTEYSGSVSNKDVLDLVFVLDPAFIDGKTNVVFVGMAFAFLCQYEWCSKSHHLCSIADIWSFPAPLMHSNGVWIASKIHFQSMFLIGLVFFKSIVGIYFVNIQSNKAISVSTQMSSTSHRMCGSIYVIVFTNMASWWLEFHANHWFGQKH